MAIYKINEKDAKLHISKGNSKIGKGIWSFSTLPGNTSHLMYIKDPGGNNVLLTDIPGTCSKYCDTCARDGACYAWRDAKLHHNVTIKAWGENTLLKRSGKVWEMINKFLYEKNAAAANIIYEHKKWLRENGSILETSREAYWNNIIKRAREAAKIKLFRIHVSGEIESATELKCWAEIALTHPETTFGIYTKNYDALEEYLQYTVDSGRGVPDNFVINVSEWHGVAKDFIDRCTDKYPGTFNIFEYDDTNKKDCSLSDPEKERLANITHCVAVDKNGHHVKLEDGTSVTCDMCGRCYHKTGSRTAVWSH